MTGMAYQFILKWSFQFYSLNNFEEIYDRVRKEPGPDEELYRPQIPESALSDDPVEPHLINLMMGCWAEEPHDRPDFSVIRKVVRSLNKLVCAAFQRLRFS